MKKIFMFFILLSISQLLNAQNYKQVKIYFNDRNELKEIYKLGLDIDEGYIGKDNSVSVFVSHERFPMLVNSRFNFEILIDDWFAHFASRSKLNDSQKAFYKRMSEDRFGVTGFGYGSMGGNYTMQEVYNELDNMRTQYPNLITAKFPVGTTFENRSMYVAKISDNPDIDENEPKVFYNSLIHCREPQGMMTLMYYMFYLLENYGVDPAVTYLVDNREIYFMPIINVDGYEYNRTSNPNGGGMWRKNRRGSGANVWGIDLNRNFGYQWGYDNNGSSPYQSDETYRGTAAFSEPETQVVRDFCISKNFNVVMNYHTYSNLLLGPWGYITQESADSLLYREYMQDVTSWNGYTWGVPGAILYEVNGGADDWMYGEQTLKQKAFAMTLEVGGSSDGFWPDQDRIFPLAEENLNPNLYLTWIAGDYVKFLEAHFNQEYFNPGESIEMTAIVKNKGLGDASNVSIELLSDDPAITINFGLENIGTVNSQQSDSNSTPFNFTISSTALPGSKVPLVVSIKTGSILMATDTVYITIGTPTILFADETNDPTINWALTATPTSSKWEATTTSYHSAPISYTESKSGNYPDNATITMTLKDAIDLTGISGPTLSYWTKWNMETDWDYGQVSITTNNGTTWIPLSGDYMNAGTGSFQPSGQPLYDGVQSTWVKEDIDLSAYVGTQIKLRFQFRSDGSQTRDGWYVDDIEIFHYESNILTKNVSVLAGWNIISVPVLADDMMVTTLFPTAVSNAFDYSGSYNQVSELSTGKGYWLKFDTAKEVAISGTSNSMNINVTSGWNIIGPFHQAINTSSITTIPANIIVSNFFGFDGSYISATTLEPGKGYWVKTDQAGELVLNTAVNKSDVTYQEDILQIDPDREIIFTFTDSKEKAITLRTGLLPDATIELDKGIGEYEIPPTPPSDVFSAAFELNSGERLFTDYRQGDSEFEGNYEHIINVNRKADNAVIVKSDLPGGVSLCITDTFDGTLFNYTTTDLCELLIPVEFIKIKMIISYDLPAAELYSFNTQISYDVVVLNWITSKERNNAGFKIERSTDAINFKEIAFINGKGNYKGASEYAYSDTKVIGGKYFYRLGMTDYDGTVHYSEIIETELSIPSEFALQQNYPNPFNPSTTIKFDLPVQSNVNITLYDVLGRKIDVITAGMFEAGHHRIQFEKGDLTTGVYIYSLTANGEDGKVYQNSKKLMIVK
ncbi:MAG: M14 family zinc carboxypeptidase [bacterium]